MRHPATFITMLIPANYYHYVLSTCSTKRVDHTNTRLSSQLERNPGTLYLNSQFSTHGMCYHILSPAGAVGPGMGDIATPPICLSVRLSVCLSVCPSVTFSFRTVTRKRIDVFSRNFAGTCTMSWGCAV